MYSKRMNSEFDLHLFLSLIRISHYWQSHIELFNSEPSYSPFLWCLRHFPRHSILLSFTQPRCDVAAALPRIRWLGCRINSFIITSTPIKNIAGGAGGSTLLMLIKFLPINVFISTNRFFSWRDQIITSINEAWKLITCRQMILQDECRRSCQILLHV